MSKSLIFAAVLGIVGVMIGAYAAHGLEAFLQKQSIEPQLIIKRLDQCEVAVRYHMTHTLAILALSLSSLRRESRIANTAIVFWALGILLFSGGLYSMVFLGKMGHWAIVPSGGLCFMIGWFALAMFGATRRNGRTSTE
jgi:uncharacterized membrane protein YgdD (TMEM256/DUF423 family)